MFDKMAFAMAMLLASAAMVAAGGSAEPADPPAVVAPSDAPAIDPFEGFYVGLAFGNVGGDGNEGLGAISGPFDVDRDAVLGAIGGYNFQHGRLVLGAELAAWAVDTPINDGSVVELNRLADVRGRVGWASGNFLLYGAVGWSWARTENTASGVESDHDGHNLGVGVEYNVSETLFLGLDYTARDLDGDGPADLEYDMDVNTLSLRGGFRF